MNYGNCLPARILSLLASAPEPMNCNEIATALDAPTDRVIDAVADLRSSEQIQRLADERPYRYALPIPMVRAKVERDCAPPVTAW
jgi:DNA-binding IclR family transcriptional regulator